MEPSVAAMEAALRVLTAITERRPPNPADVAELHSFAPDTQDVAPDELACEVIQQAIRATQMEKAQSGGG
jgi:hypothetical protein